jgi:hypothetical protein
MKRVIPLLLSSLLCAPALADDFDIVNPDQGAFDEVSKDLVAALSYKALAPAEATGITGFGIGAFGTYMSTDNKDAWQTLTGQDVSEIGMAGLLAHKGLPFGVDVGAYYAYIPGAEAEVFGGELRYAILEGGIAMPALAVRGSFTKLSGVDDFDVSTYGLDLTASKGFTFLTPYAGVGYVWGSVDPSSDTGLDTADVDDFRFYLGMRISLGLLEFTPEYEHIGSSDAFNLRAGFSF